MCIFLNLIPRGSIAPSDIKLLEINTFLRISWKKERNTTAYRLCVYFRIHIYRCRCCGYCYYSFFIIGIRLHSLPYNESSSLAESSYFVSLICDPLIRIRAICTFNSICTFEFNYAVKFITQTNAQAVADQRCLEQCNVRNVIIHTRTNTNTNHNPIAIKQSAYSSNQIEIDETNRQQNKGVSRNHL